MLQFNSILNGGGGGGGTIDGSGTPPYLPIWVSPTTLGDSKLYQPNDTTLQSDSYNAVNFYLDSNTGVNADTFTWVNYTNNSNANTYSVFTLLNTGQSNTQVIDSWVAYDKNSAILDEIKFQFNLFSGNIPYRRYSISYNNNPFLEHYYYGNKTHIFNANLGGLVPIAEDSYNVLLGGGKTFGFGSGGTVPNGKFIGNIWNDYYPDLNVTYSFSDGVLLSGCASETRFTCNGGNWLMFATSGGNRRMYASFTSLTGFNINTTGTNVTAVAGLHVHGLYTFSNTSGGIVSIQNYYGIYINDSNEYGNSAEIVVAGRYAIYQEGATDMNFFNGYLGFYGRTPVPIQTNTIASATRTAVGGANVQANDTFGGYTIGQIVTALKSYGLLN